MKTLLMNTLCYVILSSFAFAQQTPVTPFITTWLTDNPGTSANNQITIPTTDTGYNYSVAWENVNDTTISGTNGPFTGDATLTFPQAGTYRVNISGDFPRIFFNNVGDREKLLTVEQWGSNPWQSMASAFYGCSNLTVPAQDIPDLANVTDMSRMFQSTTSFNQPIGNWNVSNVTDMLATFAGAISFNQNIGGWNVENVTNMSAMFSDAVAFNQDIGAWNVQNVTNMRSMFADAVSFNQDIGAWNVQNVTNMRSMFAEATSFNQNIGAWNVQNVTNMRSMFADAVSFNQDIGAWNVQNTIDMTSMFALATAFNQDIGAWNVQNVNFMVVMFAGATAFNQDIGAWNVQNVTNMATMFSFATAFNQDISSWNVQNVTNMSGMFLAATAFDQNIGTWNVQNVTDMGSMLVNSGLSIANYDSTLIGWAALPALQTNVTLGASNLQYCNAEAARDTLINTFNWTIADAGRNCGGPAARLASEPNDVTRMAGDQENSWHSIIVYPNPATDQFMTVFTWALAAPARWVLTDHMGQQVARGNLVEGTIRQAISTDGLAPGTYFYRLVVGGNITSTKRVVIAR